MTVLFVYRQMSTFEVVIRPIKPAVLLKRDVIVQLIQHRQEGQLKSSAQWYWQASVVTWAVYLLVGAARQSEDHSFARHKIELNVAQSFAVSLENIVFKPSLCQVDFEPEV